MRSPGRTPAIMFQGTGSHAGKSVVRVIDYTHNRGLPQGDSVSLKAGLFEQSKPYKIHHGQGRFSGATPLISFDSGIAK